MNRFPRIMNMALLLCVSASHVVGQPPAIPSKPFSFAQVTDVQVSPSGTRVLAVERTENPHTMIYEIDTETHEAKLVSPELNASESAPQWSPDGESMAFLCNRGGSTNIWIADKSGEHPWQLTHSVEVTDFRWSPSGAQIAFAAIDNSQPNQHSDEPEIVGESGFSIHLWVIALDKEQKPDARQLTYGPDSAAVGMFGGFGWSPQGNEIVFTKAAGVRLSDLPSLGLAIVEVRTGTVRTLVNTSAAEMSPCFSPDGQQIAYVASDIPMTWAGDFLVHVIRVDGTGDRALSPTPDRWPRLLGWSPRGDALMLTEQLRAGVALYSLPVNGGSPHLIKASGLDVFSTALNASRTWLGFVCQDFDKAPEACISSSEDFAAQRVTDLNSEHLDLPRTVLLRWNSVDGTEIEGAVTFPEQYKAGARCPLLVILHGGPAEAVTNTYIGAANMFPVAIFASRGFAVFQPNYRGSTGYGREFRYADVGDWGGKDAADVISGVKMLIRKGIADPDHVGIMGWSYGGYLALSILEQTRLFGSASVGAAASDLISHSGSTDLPAYVSFYMKGQFWDAWRNYYARSPLFHAAQITAPILIQQGKDDTRVRPDQAYELYYGLHHTGHTVSLVVYPSMGHSPWNPDTIAAIADRNIDWFSRYCRQQGPAIGTISR